MKKRLGIEEATFISLIIFILIAVFIKGKGPTSLIIALLSVATFLFGIFGAFVMQNRHRRLDQIRTVLRQDDALYVNIYKLTEFFGKKIQKNVQKLIDQYFIKTIDYELFDYNKANKEFLKIYDYIIKLKPKNSKQMEIFGELLDCIDKANENRKHTEYLVNNTMLRFKWLILIGLLSIILFSVFYINDNSMPSIIITVLLSTSSMMLLLVLRDLDGLRWKEQRWIWDPLAQLFKEMDLLPYFPDYIIRLKRVKLEKGVKARVAYYQKPYPDFTGKKIKIEIIQ